MTLMYFGSDGAYELGAASTVTASTINATNSSTVYGGLYGGIGMAGQLANYQGQYGNLSWPGQAAHQQAMQQMPAPSDPNMSLNEYLARQGAAQKAPEPEELSETHRLTKFEKKFREKWGALEATPATMLMRLRYEIEKWHGDVLDRWAIA